MGKIEEAITVLEENITAIHTVPEWAERMGYPCEKYFSRKIRTHYQQSPYRLIVEKKMDRIKQELKNSSDDILFSVALELGFVDNNALYKFVKRHSGKTPTELKWESEMGE
jgi:AraC-like DNA-binding protein